MSVFGSNINLCRIESRPHPAWTYVAWDITNNLGTVEAMRDHRSLMVTVLGTRSELPLSP